LHQAERAANREQRLPSRPTQLPDHSRSLSKLLSLRARLGDDAANPRLIGTVRGVGYKFTARPERQQADQLGET
jgi:DNA-binding response OmpR family regulator